MKLLEGALTEPARRCIAGSENQDDGKSPYSRAKPAHSKNDPLPMRNPEVIPGPVKLIDGTGKIDRSGRGRGFGFFPLRNVRRPGPPGTGKGARGRYPGNGTFQDHGWGVGGLATRIAMGTSSVCGSSWP